VDRGLRVVFFGGMAMGGSEPADLVYVGLLHALEELAGRTRKATRHSAAGPRRSRVEEPKEDLPEPEDAGDDSQAIVRDREGDVLEIMDSPATDKDGVVH